MKKKLLIVVSLVLAVAAIVTASVMGTIAYMTSASKVSNVFTVGDVYITLDESNVNPNGTLAENGKETLTALVTLEHYDSRAWQIRIPDTEEWVNISGKNGKTLDVTYALVGSMLNASGRAHLRHVVKSGEAVFESKPVEVILSYNTPEGAESARSTGGTVFAMRRLATANEGDASNTDGEVTHELVSIVINYLFDNGGLAFEPYGATIAKGSDFKTEEPIKSPDVTGYEPFRRIGADYVDASYVSFDLTNVQENVTVNVIYEPAIVEFKVHHHLQNINDDGLLAP